MQKIVDFLESTMVGSWVSHFGITLGAGLVGSVAGYGTQAAWAVVGAYLFREYVNWNPRGGMDYVDNIMDGATPIAAALTLDWASGFLSGLL